MEKITPMTASANQDGTFTVMVPVSLEGAVDINGHQIAAYKPEVWTLEKLQQDTAGKRQIITSHQVAIATLSAEIALNDSKAAAISSIGQ